MQTVFPSEFRRGMTLLLEGIPQIIEDLHVSGTAQARHKLHARLRNLKTGRLAERSFSETERVPVAELEHRRVQFSYRQGDNYFFLDQDTFEEWVLSAAQLGDQRLFLTEDAEYRALILEGNIVDVVLPPQMALRVVETAPPIKGGSDATWKPARFETGLEIMVPLFIAVDDIVRVDTVQRKYVGKQGAG